ncbi:hypothetical protein ACQKKG_02690 [Brevundimonas sp. NPDC003935]|uniref:hypothetical protein n=1 Tax=unclassified Brevundimonas TaxID=2622653 RepID=UPI00289EEA7A|nr:hypothetical protein [Brevundimonas sp.]
MDQLSTLILIGALAFVVAGAGFAFVQPRRFTDRDADGEPDATSVEVDRAHKDDGWNRRAGK